MVEAIWKLSNKFKKKAIWIQSKEIFVHEEFGLIADRKNKIYFICYTMWFRLKFFVNIPDVVCRRKVVLTCPNTSTTRSMSHLTSIKNKKLR